MRKVKPAKPSPKPNDLADYEPYIRQRLIEGEWNKAKLWREIRAKGSKASYKQLYSLLEKYPKNKKPEEYPLLLKAQKWSITKAAFLIAKDKDKVEKEDALFLSVLGKHLPCVLKATKLFHSFKAIICDQLHPKLTAWIVQAKKSGIPALKSFANGLTQDLAAVTATATIEWSNGQVEGQVNRLKTIKRQMYGRASFQLLRKRVLYSK